jgi:hypothetical protein
MRLALGLQHLLATTVPAAVAGTPRFVRELRGHMRLAALRWRAARELRERELALDCLANAVQWRNAAEDATEMLKG